jgi:hypothetical protein
MVGLCTIKSAPPCTEGVPGARLPRAPNRFQCQSCRVGVAVTPAWANPPLGSLFHHNGCGLSSVALIYRFCVL